VIGGGAGFFAMHKIERSARIGVSLCLFSITFILGSAQGVTRRTGLPWSAFWTAPQPSALWLPVKDVTPEEAIKLIQLRAEIEGSDELDAEEKRSVWYLITSEVTGNEQISASTFPADFLLAILLISFKWKIPRRQGMFVESAWSNRRVYFPARDEPHQMLGPALCRGHNSVQ
jgi:hypothetical protein